VGRPESAAMSLHPQHAEDYFVTKPATGVSWIFFFGFKSKLLGAAWGLLLALTDYNFTWLTFQMGLSWISTALWDVSWVYRTTLWPLFFATCGRGLQTASAVHVTAAFSAFHDTCSSLFAVCPDQNSRASRGVPITYVARSLQQKIQTLLTRRLANATQHSPS